MSPALARLRDWLTEPRHMRGRMSALLFALFMIAYAPFTQDVVSHNTLCRAAMTANMVQYGRIDINGYETLTRDKARFGENYYCDKAPGMSFLAAPVAFAFTRVFAVTPETPYNRVWSAFLYLGALSTSALLAAFAGVLLFRHVLQRTANLDAALVSAIAFGLSGPIWGWATSLFSHAVTAASLVMGFIALDHAYRRAADGKSSALAAMLAGLAFGVATATEYTALAPAIIIGAALSAPHIAGRWLTIARVCSWATLGALAALAPVLVFHAAAFGSPFETGYTHTVEFDLHRTGLVGVGVPQLDVLARLIVSSERGVIWYAPVILMTVWASWRLARTPGNLAVGLATLGVVAAYLLMNAGFVYWEGGASTGPRYLTPAVGFSALSLGLAWPHFSLTERRIAAALLALTVVVGFACVSVGMTAGDLFSVILPRLFAGELHATLTYMVVEDASVLHFVAPLLGLSVMAWLLLRARSAATERA